MAGLLDDCPGERFKISGVVIAVFPGADPLLYALLKAI